MSSFKLVSEDSEFNNRVDALFDSLKTVAVDLKSTDSPPPQTQGKRSWEEDSDDVGECSSLSGGRKFTKPVGLPPRWRGGGGRGRAPMSFGPRNSTPDYLKNPQKWTRYNMKDIEVSSDRENKQIGLELIDELRTRKNDPETDSGVEDGCPKIVFKKPVKSDKNVETPDETENSSADAFFGGTKKFRMDEYEVGAPKQKPKSKIHEKLGTEAEKKKDSVRLDYLTFDDEEEDE